MLPGYYDGGLHLHENKVIEEGQTADFQCSSPGVTGRITCQNGRIRHTACKYKYNGSWLYGGFTCHHD